MKQPLDNLQDMQLSSEFKHNANTPSEQMQTVCVKTEEINVKHQYQH